MNVFVTLIVGPGKLGTDPMDAVAEIGRNPVRTRFSLSMAMSRLTRDGTAEPVSRGQILRRERGQRKNIFFCSAGHEQLWQLYPVGPCTCYTSM